MPVSLISWASKVTRLKSPSARLCGSVRSLSSVKRAASDESLHLHAWLHFGYRPAIRRKLIVELDHYTRGSSEDDASEPEERHGMYLYRAARPDGSDNVVHYRRWAPAGSSERPGQEHTVLDMNEVASESGYASLGVMRLSPDPAQSYLAYSVDLTGGEVYEARIVQLPVPGTPGRVDSNPVLARIPGAVGTAWAPHVPGTPPTLYYARAQEDTRRTYQVWAHTLGQGTQQDVLLWQEDRPGRYVDVSSSKDGEMCFITSSDRDSNDVYLLAYSNTGGGGASEPGVVCLFSGYSGSQPAFPAVPILMPQSCAQNPPIQYFVEHLGSGWLLLVNTAEGAVDYRLSVLHMSQLLPTHADALGRVQSCSPQQLQHLSITPPSSPTATVTGIGTDMTMGSRATTEDGLVIEDVDVFAGSGAGLTVQNGHVVVYCRLQSVPQVRILRLQLRGPGSEATASRVRSEARILPLQHRGSTVSSVVPAGNPDPCSPILRFSVASCTGPPQDYVYDIKTERLTLTRSRRIGSVPSRPLFHAEDYVSYTLRAPSLDGSQVPMTIVHARVPTAVARPGSAGGEAASDWVPPDPEQVQETAARLTAACASFFSANQAEISALLKLWSKGDPLGVGGPNVPSPSMAALQPLIQACAGNDDWRMALQTQCTRDDDAESIFGRVLSGLSSRLPLGPGSAPPRVQVHPYPCLVQAYGAYGQLQETDFSPRRLPLLSRGWVLAFPAVRGGGEGGRHWYHAGRGMNKLHSMLDTVAALRMLIATGLATSELLAMRTASAGCLLSAWLCNTHPGLVRAHIMASPFLDPLHAMMDDSAPLTASEYSEWGNPAQSTEERAYLQSYSPLTQLPSALTRARAWRSASNRTPASDNGRTENRAGTLAGKWPAQLITCSLEDPRTPAADALRYVSTVRSYGAIPACAGMEAELAMGGQGTKKRRRPGFSPPVHATEAVEAQDPLLLCHALDSGGHFGAAGRSAGLEEVAQETLFLYRAMGLQL